MNCLRYKSGSSGFSAYEVVQIVFILGLFAGLLLPALLTPRVRTSRINCVNNVKQIGVGFKTWAIDNNDHYPTQVSTTNGGVMELPSASQLVAIFQVMSNELGTPKLLVCAEDTTRISATNFASGLSVANISYFFVRNPNDTHPQMILAGDSNLTNNIPRLEGVMTLSSNTVAYWMPPRHKGNGNILLVDGSVQQLTTPALQTTIHKMTETNYLLMP